MMPAVSRVSRKQQPVVLIHRPQDRSGVSHERLRSAGCLVRIVAPDQSLGDAIAGTGAVHAILAASLRGERLDRPRLERLSALRIVSKYTIGVDDIDTDAATELGIIVTHCPTEANYGGVAEGTIALMLALLKKIEIRDAAVRAGGWRDDALRGTYLGARDDGYPGITLGIIGLGRIGRRVADLMVPWKVRVIATDPYVEDAVFIRHGAERVPLDTLLRRADVVSMHCSLTRETDGLIDRSKLALMQAHAILINTARGRIVDTDAVCDALEAKRLGGAAFDVLPEEPPPADSRILETDGRVILSPHMAAANEGGTLGAAIPGATEAVLMALAGKVPPHVYNREVIDHWKSRFAGSPLLT